MDLANAYPARIGEWDKTAIEYGYRTFANEETEAAELAKILDDAWAKDLRYMTNQDLGVHPRVDQWSNGVNQADELNRIFPAAVRVGRVTPRGEAPIRII